MRLRLNKRWIFAVLAAYVMSTAAVRAEVTTAPSSSPAATTPEALEQRLMGKTVYLRGFYLDDHLEFDTAGKIEGTPARGSFTLSALEIKKVHFTKHSMQIEGDRYGLHFFGALPYEDDSKPFEKIRVSKKPVEITIERVVIEPEKKKKKNKDEVKAAKAGEIAKPGDSAKTGGAALTSAVITPDSEGAGESSSAPASPLAANAAAPATKAVDGTTPVHRDPKESYVLLSGALDKIFATSLDQSVISTLPDYWQNYFASKAGKIRAAAVDASALHPGNGVRAPHLLTMIDPDSNDYAQKNNIAGMILLQTVVSANGKPGQVTIVRPIGFGLDEKAVEAIERSQFRPGTQEGKPVPVIVNLEVTFRIYSERTRPKAVPPPSQVAPKAAPAPTNRKDTGTALAAATVNE